jgi:XTP/dITP diphosphohydrolase
LLEFLDVMRRLRAECPWKAEQTHRSLSRYLLEETHETLEAIDAGDRTGDWTHLREELGDLLLQVYFHGVLAEEAGSFTLDDVARDVIDKMVRRNPHVFGSPTTGAPTARDAAPTGGSLTAEEVNEAWEAVKAQEKSQRTSVTDGLPPGLPALLYADKVLDRLSRRPGTPGRVERPTGHLMPRGSADRALDDGSADLGDRLLGLVAEARRDGVDPEQALRDAVRRLLSP